jgi:hypothetical protein
MQKSREVGDNLQNKEGNKNSANYKHEACVVCASFEVQTWHRCWRRFVQIRVSRTSRQRQHVEEEPEEAIYEPDNL